MNILYATLLVCLYVWINVLKVVNKLVLLIKSFKTYNATVNINFYKCIHIKTVSFTNIKKPQTSLILLFDEVVHLESLFLKKMSLKKVLIGNFLKKSSKQQFSLKNVL